MTAVFGNKRLLFAPLNWGLGHVARSVPLIHACRKAGAEVWIASDGEALTFAQQEVPDAHFLELPSYRPYYSRTNRMVASMLQQTPKFLRVLRKEHQWLQKYIAHYQIDGVVSDNRWGCYSHQVPSVILTHQINLQVPKWAALSSFLLNRFNHYLLSKFDECWVPDIAGRANLSGALSKATNMEGKVRFIGPLSRLTLPVTHSHNQWNALVLLSGPEPQRSILEELVIGQLAGMEGSYFVVRGVSSPKSFNVPAHIEVVNMLKTEELECAMHASEIVIARAGYSTIMDLEATGQKAVLVPTPGQTEQEYLAKRLHHQGRFYSVFQDQLQLERDLALAHQYKGGVGKEAPFREGNCLEGFLQRL